ncbi:transcriptional regulator, MerR family protein [marine actinobacterium PHSC20C1]|nr:transcriptional regulator, MerR family protein [marine actinobacterium PHSC20C1]
MKIGELAALTGVSVRSLRYYEQQGLIEPQRSSTGHRLYSATHETAVAHIRELLRAGFCSSVIRILLPALTEPEGGGGLLRSSFAAAEARLESEIASVETELSALRGLRDRLQLAPDTHVMPKDEGHDPLPTSKATAFDHRDRRLR